MTWTTTVSGVTSLYIAVFGLTLVKLLFNVDYNIDHNREDDMENEEEKHDEFDE